MSDTGHTTQGEDDLGRLALEVERLLAEGASVDVDQLAREFRVPVADAQDVIDALDAFEDVLFEPLQEVVKGEDEAVPPPTLPEDYELLGELGRGGMGIVYRARQKSLDRDVAIKVLRPGELTFGKMLRRFEQEAKSLARLKHPHIVSIHEVGKADGCVYFTMDLVDGRPLSELVKERQVTPTEAVRLLRQVASAISYTHGLGVIHRDLKPANILVDKESRAFVVDFGLARDLAGPDELTRTGQVIGTANYMSPEQARGDKGRIGEATDVYALGAVLYECLTGKPPFHGKGLAELMSAILSEQPEAPTKVDPRVPKALETICFKAMAKDPERRYATARALLDDLERFEEGRSIRARPPGFIDRFRAGWQRHWRVATVGLAAAIVAGLSVLLWLLPQTGETVENLRVTAKNLASARKYDAAATVVERALALRGLDIPEAHEEEPPALSPHLVRRTFGLIHVWARYKARHLEQLYRQGEYRKTMIAADDTVQVLARVERMTRQRNRSNKSIDALWYGAAAAGMIGDAGTPARFHTLFQATREHLVPAYPGDVLIGGGNQAYRLYRLRRDLVPILADPDHTLHPWVRRLTSALLMTEAGRESFLSLRRQRLKQNDLSVNLYDHIPAIVKGAARSAYNRMVDDPRQPRSGEAEGVIEEAWFDVSDDLVVEIWWDVRNLLRRLAIGDAEQVYQALEALAREENADEPLIARWALGLLAIGLDLPPWWDRDRPPPAKSPGIDKLVWGLVDASRGSGMEFLTARTASANEWANSLGAPKRRDLFTFSRVGKWIKAHIVASPFTKDERIAQELLRGLVDPNTRISCHGALVERAPDRASAVLWGEWAMPLASSALDAGEESLYRLWLFELAARGTGVVREDAFISSRVMTITDGHMPRIQLGYGRWVNEFDTKLVGIGQLAHVHAGWFGLTGWPEARLELEHRPGLAGLTFQPRRRMIAEPGTSLTELMSFWKVRTHASGLVLDFGGARISERGAGRATWAQVAAPTRRIAGGDVAILRFERHPLAFTHRRPEEMAAAPSQSVVAFARMYTLAEVQETRSTREWGAWAMRRIREILEADPALEQPGRADATKRFLIVLAYVPWRDGSVDLERLPLDELRATAHGGVHDAAMLVLARHGQPRGLDWLSQASDAHIERGLEALEMTTPLARCEHWYRILQSSDPKQHDVALRRLNALTLDSGDHTATLAGIFAALDPYVRTRQDVFSLRQATGFGSELRAQAEPTGLEVMAPYAVILLAILGVLLFVLLAIARVKNVQRPRLALAGLALGWLLTGQQVFALPDVDLFIEAVGLVLMWRALVALAPADTRRELAAPSIVLFLALAATITERADADGEVFGRLAMALVGAALVLIPFWVDRLIPQNTSRWRWALPFLAMLLLVPTVFVATVQGPALDQYMLSYGDSRVWEDVPFGLLCSSYLAGCALVFTCVAAYARRVARAG